MTYLWSDAWLLQAVAVASRSGAATLAEIIAAADAVNHTLLAFDELHGGLCRLTEGAFVEETAAGFTLGTRVPAEAALALAGDNAHHGRDAASNLLNAESWTEETNVRDPRNKVVYPGLTKDRLRTAYRKYSQEGRRSRS